MLHKQRFWRAGCRLTVSVAPRPGAAVQVAMLFRPAWLLSLELYSFSMPSVGGECRFRWRIFAISWLVCGSNVSPSLARFSLGRLTQIRYHNIHFFVKPTHLLKKSPPGRGFKGLRRVHEANRKQLPKYSPEHNMLI